MLLALGGRPAPGQTFVPTGSSNSWDVDTNWSPVGVPNGIGASANFSSTNSGNRTATLNAAITVGSLSITNNTAFTNTISNGTGGSLTFDAAGTGPAMITVAGAGTAVNTITATMVLGNSLTLDVTHSAGSSTSGALNLNGAMSGAFGVSKTGAGMMAITGIAKTYSGGTTVNGGTLVVSGLSASLGTGNVTVTDATAGANLVIRMGVLDSIADSAVLSLAGGGTANTADVGYLTLGTNINETVGGLVLGGVVQGPGTYGAVGSGATFTSNEYFAGPGIITVAPVPEPAAVLLIAAGGLGAIRLVRRRLSR